jgi:UDPglucose 6-dehydrogenase
VPDLAHLAQDADALVLVTDWPEFRELPFRELAARMRCPLIVDGRNSLDRELVTASGLEYLGIGR